MRANRRQFIATALAGGVATATSSLSSYGSQARNPGSAGALNPRYPTLDEILKQPVLKKELFTTPVIIETLELLRYRGNFLCRVRSTDGAEGLSVGHGSLSSLYPIFIHRLQPFFIGKDARDLDLLLEKVYIYDLNFRLNGMALGIPLATIEFAILDMLGRIANKSMGQLIGDIHHPQVGVYQAEGHQGRRAQGKNRDHHSADPRDIWRRYGPLCRCEWLLFSPRGHTCWTLAGRIPLWLF